MNILKVSTYFLIYFLLSACASNHLTTANTSGYYDNDFPQEDFITTPTSKKKQDSDQQLMLSLLNREIPQDQLMMLAFANKESYKRFDNYKGIKIKGAYSKDRAHSRVTSQYSHLIVKDNNAVAISMMPN